MRSFRLPATLAASWLLASGITSAAPLPKDGYPTEWAQPDGTRLAIRIFGDEFYTRATTTEGYTVVFDPAVKAYFHAIPSRDGKGLVSSGIQAHQPPPAGLAKNLREPKEAAEAKRAAGIAKLAPDQDAKWAARVKAVNQKRSRPAGAAPLSESPQDAILSAPVNGFKVGLTIIVQFPDDTATPASDPVTFPTTQAKINRYCNQSGYTDDGNTGSIVDYFYDQSGGQLSFVQTVTPIVTLPHPRDYYVYSDYPANNTFKYHGYAGQDIVTDAVNKLKLDGFDFSTLTADADNRVLATSLLFAGSRTPVSIDGQVRGLWPHKWGLYGSEINVGTVANPKYILGYQITDVPNAAPVIGTVCHELGHLLMGYPDLYDGDNDSEGVGRHCIMGSGNYLNGERTPAPINLYLKDISGWANITDLAIAPSLDMTLPSTGNRGYRFRKPGTTKEYFLIENRGIGDKWATHTPDKGVLIWHIDEEGDNDYQDRTPARHYELSVEQADGLFDLEHDSNRGDSGDLYDNTTGPFDDTTTPNARWWDGQKSGASFAVTSPPGASMNVHFSAAPPVNTGEIEVRLDNNPPMSDGSGTLSFGAVPAGGQKTIYLGIKNIGPVDLTGISAAIDGLNGTGFTVGYIPSTLPPDFLIGLSITFSPNTIGSRSATLHIASSDPDKNPFDINLTATGVTPYQSYSSSGGLVVPTSGNASTYPSIIQVAGFSGKASAVRVKLNGLTHRYPAELDVFLVSPSGRVAAVLSDAAGGGPLADANLVFDDSAPTAIPELSQITSGSYRPANYGETEPLPPGATGSIGTNLSALATGGVNGDWKLFVSDDTPDDGGSLGSWSLEIDNAVNGFANGTPLGAGSEARAWHTSTQLPNGKILVAGGGNGSSYFNTAIVHDPATGTWLPTGSLATGRNNHTATVLPNGKVLVAGGQGAGGVSIASAEIYDPATGTWSATGPLAVARGYHTANLLPNGKVLVSGGRGASSGNALSSAELYNPVTGTWSSAGSFAAVRQSHSATSLPDGKVLVAGGFNSTGAVNSAQLYDPATNGWSSTGSLATARSGHASVLLPNGKVLIAGGSGASSLASAELYNPATGTFSATGALATARAYFSATLLPNGKVFAAGGFGTTHLASTEIYDPATGTWSDAGFGPTARASHAATLMFNGKVLLSGGGNTTGFLASTETYQTPGADSWTSTGSPATNRTDHTTTLLANGKILVAGGANSGGATIGTAELYDPATGLWTSTGSLVTPRHSATATLLANGMVLLTGGFESNSYSSATTSAELYNPSAGQWSATTPMPEVREPHTATRLADGRVLFIGGFDWTGSALPISRIYNPTTTTWSLASIGGYLRHTATLLPDGKVLVAGGASDTDGHFTSTTKLYDPAANSSTPSGTLNSTRLNPTATLLHNGKVLLTGGISYEHAFYGNTYDASTEIYDPATGTWTYGGSLSAGRGDHAAVLLPSGGVLVMGGGNKDQNFDRTELYDPATNTWKTSGVLAHPALKPSGFYLTNGKVIFSTGSTGELYDTALATPPAVRPVITSAGFASGGKLFLSGNGFKGASEASGGNGAQDSPTNFPVVQLRLLDNGRTTFLTPDPATSPSATAYTSVAVPAFTGHALVTVFTNGIASSSTVVTMAVEPDLVVTEFTAGTPVPNGFSWFIGTSSVGGSPAASVRFILSNPGGSNLTVTTTLTGTHAAEFGFAGGPPAAGLVVPPGGTTSVTVTFNPNPTGLTGSRSASLRMVSNAPGKSPYVVNLSATAVTHNSDTDGDGLDDASEYNMSLLGFDMNVSQPPLVSAYRDHANGAGYYTLPQIQQINVGTPLIAKDPSTGLFKLTIGMEKSTDLQTFTPFPFTSPQTTVNGQGKLEFQFTSPGNAAFFRLKPN